MVPSHMNPFSSARWVPFIFFPFSPGYKNTPCRFFYTSFDGNTTLFYHFLFAVGRCLRLNPRAVCFHSLSRFSGEAPAAVGILPDLIGRACRLESRTDEKGSVCSGGVHPMAGIICRGSPVGLFGGKAHAVSSGTEFEPEIFCQKSVA